MTDATDIMVIASSGDAHVQPVIYDLLAFARRLQELRPGAVVGAWVLGEGAGEAAREIARRGGVRVTAVECAGLSHYTSETYAEILVQEIAAANPAFICAAHTSEGWEWAPAVAARIGAGCICGVDGMSEIQGRVCFQKEVYGGKVKGLFSPSTDTTILTIQTGLFKFAPPSEFSPGCVIYKTIVCQPVQTRYLGKGGGGSDTSDITSAPVVVAVGNGIGNQENIELAHRLAKLLPRAAVAGSRIVCDRGWLGYDRQIGISGAIVSPALYVALGISGASQHVSGMRGAGYVIAINTDPGAPIFNEADICIVEDIIQFVPLVEAACARLAEDSKTDD